MPGKGNKSRKSRNARQGNGAAGLSSTTVITTVANTNATPVEKKVLISDIFASDLVGRTVIIESAHAQFSNAGANVVSGAVGQLQAFGPPFVIAIANTTAKPFASQDCKALSPTGVTRMEMVVREARRYQLRQPS